MASEVEEIFSPNHPHLYPSNKDCSWQIVGGPNMFIEAKVVNMDVQANVRCMNDYLMVRCFTTQSCK